MNINILANAVQDYIDANLNADVNQIALAKSAFHDITSAEIAGQITAKKKSEKKLPTWFNALKIYYPAALSIEQTSSETTAQYKAKLAKGNSLIDVTGGFGVDAYYFAKVIPKVTHCEINHELSDIAKHNAKVLGANNIDFLATDGIEYIKNNIENYDTLYVDPARRAEKGKVFMLKDCSPDVVTNLDRLLEKASRMIIKTAPLLDITAGLLELKHVSQIHIVSVKNECKELLWVIDKDFVGEVEITAVTLNETEKHFTFTKSMMNCEVKFSSAIAAGQYLYEPDTALLKSGAFNLIANKYALQKLHPQSQLYTSEKIDTSFPGRIFKIDRILTTAELKKSNEISANVIVRNYPAKPEDLVKKYKIKPNKSRFLIFTKTANGDNVVIDSTIIQYY